MGKIRGIYIENIPFLDELWIECFSISIDNKIGKIAKKWGRDKTRMKVETEE